MGISERSKATLVEGQKTSCDIVYTIEPPSHRDLLSEVPQIQLTLEQMVACDPETVSLTFWAENSDPATIENIFRESELLHNVAVVDDTDDEKVLYQVQIPAAETTYWKWTQLGGVLLDGVGTEEGWTIRMRCPNREALHAYREHCKEKEIPFRLETLTTSELLEGDRLTTPQSQILEAAVNGGYFEIPRETTLTELATQFDVSDQAASERLRRGLSNVLTNHSSLEL